MCEAGLATDDRWSPGRRGTTLSTQRHLDPCVRRQSSYVMWRDLQSLDCPEQQQGTLVMWPTDGFVREANAGGTRGIRRCGRRDVMGATQIDVMLTNRTKQRERSTHESTNKQPRSADSLSAGYVHQNMIGRGRREKKAWTRLDEFQVVGGRRGHEPSAYEG